MRPDRFGQSLAADFIETRANAREHPFGRGRFKSLLRLVVEWRVLAEFTPHYITPGLTFLGNFFPRGYKSARIVERFVLTPTRSSYLEYRITIPILGTETGLANPEIISTSGDIVVVPNEVFRQYNLNGVTFPIVVDTKTHRLYQREYFGIDASIEIELEGELIEPSFYIDQTNAEFIRLQEFPIAATVPTGLGFEMFDTGGGVLKSRRPQNTIPGQVASTVKAQTLFTATAFPAEGVGIPGFIARLPVVKASLLLDKILLPAIVPHVQKVDRHPGTPPNPEIISTISTPGVEVVMPRLMTQADIPEPVVPSSLNWVTYAIPPDPDPAP